MNPPPTHDPFSRPPLPHDRQSTRDFAADYWGMKRHLRIHLIVMLCSLAATLITWIHGWVLRAFYGNTEPIMMFSPIGLLIAFGLALALFGCGLFYRFTWRRYELPLTTALIWRHFVMLSLALGMLLFSAPLAMVAGHGALYISLLTVPIGLGFLGLFGLYLLVMYVRMR